MGTEIAAVWQGRIAGSNQRIGKARDGHIYATPAYSAYRKDLSWQLRGVRARAFRGPVSVRIEFEIDAARDLDSAIKPTLDALQDAGVVDDDNQVMQLAVVRRTHKRGALDRVMVSVRPSESEIERLTIC